MKYKINNRCEIEDFVETHLSLQAVGETFDRAHYGFVYGVMQGILLSVYEEDEI